LRALRETGKRGKEVRSKKSMNSEGGIKKSW